MLTDLNTRTIGIYHGRPTSILRSDIDAEMPQISDVDASLNDSFNASGLLESINLTGQAEAFLNEM
jgi:hypothetical protein